MMPKHPAPEPRCPNRPRRLAIPIPPMILAALALAASAMLVSSVGQNPPPARAQGPGREWVRTAVWSPSFDGGALLDPGGLSPAPGGLIFVADRGHDRIAVVNAAGGILRTFGSRGSGPAELSGPSDVAVDGPRDRVYVVDRGNRRIAVFNLAGTPLERWQTAGPTEGFVPHAVAVAPASGDVYVLSRLPWGRVERFGRDGVWKSGFGETGSGRGQFQWPEDIAVDSTGRVLVADTNNDRIQIFSAADDTAVEAIVPLRGVAGVAVDGATGRVYALYVGAGGTLSQVQSFTAEGVPGTVLSSSAPEPFASANGIGVGNGRLAITTGAGSTDGRHGLRQYDAAGLAPAASTVTNPLGHAGFIRPTALDVRADGTVYIADGLLRVTRRYDPDGSFRERLDAGAGDDIAVGPSGEVFLVDAPVLGDVRVRRLAADGSRLWDKVCDCLSGVGAAATADRVLITNAYRQRIGVFDMAEARREPVAELTLAGAPYAWPLDLDLGPDGRLYAAGGANGRVDVLDAATGELARSWSAGEGQGAERISVGADGTVYALRFDGSLAAFAADGRLEQAWRPEPAPGAAIVVPRDIAAGPGGRLYVIDAVSDAVLVYDARAATVTPTPPATPEPPCTVTGNKTAAPTRVKVGDPVTLDLSLSIRCRPGTEPRADVMLILDRSNSMAGDKLARARAAAGSFVAGLDLSRHRVGVVTFSDLTTLDLPLTGDGPAIQAVLGAIRSDGRTDIASALDLALRHLAAYGRPEALPVILLLTDGKPSRDGQPYVDAVRQAERARASGALVYAVGLGDPKDVDGTLLTEVAGAPERYFYAPRSEDLDPIYQALSKTIGGVVATELEVVDELGPDVEYIAGSAAPAAELSGRQLRWALSTLPRDGASFRLQVRPTRTGRLNTNTQAVARYVADGVRYSFTFPVPMIDVIDLPTPTPTRAPTATPRTTTAYLPFVARNLCALRETRSGADIVLTIDTSSSMEGEKLTTAVAAARVFIDQVDARRDRVGLVSFNVDARREYVLTADLDAVSGALDLMRTGIGTRVDRGLEEALREIDLHGRTGSQPVVILLSDGIPTAGTEERTRAMAFTARASGVTIFTIGLGQGADGPFLQSLARSAAHYAFAPDARALADIYRRVAGSLPCK